MKGEHVLSRLSARSESKWHDSSNEKTLKVELDRYAPRLVIYAFDNTHPFSQMSFLFTRGFVKIQHCEGRSQA